MHMSHDALILKQSVLYNSLITCVLPRIPYTGGLCSTYTMYTAIFVDQIKIQRILDFCIYVTLTEVTTNKTFTTKLLLVVTCEHGSILVAYFINLNYNKML